MSRTFEKPRPVLDTSAAHAVPRPPAAPTAVAPEDAHAAPADAIEGEPSHAVEHETSDVVERGRSHALDLEPSDLERPEPSGAVDAEPSHPGEGDRISHRFDLGAPWFDTVRPPPMPEMIVSERPPPPPRARRSVGWTLVAIAVGASVCILGAAAKARMTAAAHAEPARVTGPSDSRAASPSDSRAASPSDSRAASPADLTQRVRPSAASPAAAAPAAPEAAGHDVIARDGNAVSRAADTGELQLPLAAKGHRIFVDGHLAGEGQLRLRLACGAHTVRVGSAGATKTVLVPCGGTVSPTP